MLVIVVLHFPSTFSVSRPTKGFIFHFISDIFSSDEDRFSLNID